MNYGCYICVGTKVKETKDDVYGTIYICPDCGMEYTWSEFFGKEFASIPFSDLRYKLYNEYYETGEIKECKTIRSRHYIHLFVKYFQGV